MLHMTLETMTGIHATLFNLATMTDKTFSSSYITASTDVIVLAAVADLLLQSIVLSSFRLRSTGASLRHLAALSKFPSSSSKTFCIM